MSDPYLTLPAKEQRAILQNIAAKTGIRDVMCSTGEGVCR